MSKSNLSRVDTCSPSYTNNLLNILTLTDKIKILKILFYVKTRDCYCEVMALKDILKIMDKDTKRLLLELKALVKTKGWDGLDKADIKIILRSIIQDYDKN